MRADARFVRLVVIGDPCVMQATFQTVDSLRSQTSFGRGELGLGPKGRTAKDKSLHLRVWERMARGKERTMYHQENSLSYLPNSL